MTAVPARSGGVLAVSTLARFQFVVSSRLRCRETHPRRDNAMPRYRVTLRRSSVEIVEASNQYQAAIVARDKFGDSVEVADVRPAVGRPSVSTGRAAKKTGKKVAKKRRPLSPEARAKLA